MYLRFKVTDSSSTGEIRRQATNIGQDLNFNEVKVGKIAIVVNELGTNILKHSGEGEIILVKNKSSLEIIAIDRGPGMKNVNECLKDGFSTQGTQGTGLGAIRRLSSYFDIYTKENQGTIVLSIFTDDDSENEDDAIECGAIMMPYPGEELCGDGWSLLDLKENRFKVLVSDGLGHGILAHEASKVAVEAFLEGKDRSPLMDINALHMALRSTRGAAIGIAEINSNKAKVDYAGLGNISASIISATTVKNLISYNGTAGVQLRKVQPMSYAFEKDSVLVMHSDGISTQWRLSDYPGLLFKHPTIIASVIFRDFCRNTDDATVVVIRKKI